MILALLQQKYMKQIQKFTLLTTLLALLSACSTAKYDVNSSVTSKVLDSGIRYGGIAAAAAGGAAGGYALGNKSPAAAVAGGLATGGLMYAFNKYMDGRKQGAYDVGVDDGAKACRAQMLSDVWTRDAVYGNGKTGGGSSAGSRIPNVRRVYVPTRTVNGVIMQGGYQEVNYYP